jgi:Spy/CpxP family protein refolding chaperone
MLKFRTAAVSAAAVIGLAVIAGAQVPAKPDSAHRGDRGGRHGDMRGMRRGGMRGERGFGGEGHLIRDLNLTDAQKSKIKAIHEKYQPQLKTLNEQGRTEFKAIRDARQKGDTSAAARQRIQTQREQFRQRVTALRTQEQNEVRAILTAEQRAKWDAAAKERKDRFEKRRKEMQARRGSRGKA